MADGVAQVPPIPGSSQGAPNQKIDTSELTRSDGTVVERQRIVLGDPVTPNSFAGVTTAGELMVAIKLDETIGQLKRIALLLEIMTGQSVSLNDAA
jgi:hypothetical protein